MRGEDEGRISGLEGGEQLGRPLSQRGLGDALPLAASGLDEILEDRRLHADDLADDRRRLAAAQQRR